MEGRHICFCGLDGSGKTTQAKLLEAKLISMDISAKVVHGFKPAVYSRELKKMANEIGEGYTTLFSRSLRTMTYIMDMWMVYYQ